jgi:hypothetical protein
MDRARMFLMAAVVSSLCGCSHQGSAVPAEADGTASVIHGTPAHIVVFRNFWAGGAPYDPIVYVDNRPVGHSRMGAVFEREVAPGPHIVTTDPKRPERAEIAPITVAPGDTVYLAVDDNWANNDTQGRQTPVFSIAAIDPVIALLHISRLKLEPGW